MANQLEFDFGQAVLSEYDEDGFLSVQPDHYGGQDAGGASAALMTPYGTQARPLDPDTASGHPTLGCGMLWVREGSRLHASLLGDPRVQKLLPKLRKGGSLTHGGDASSQGYAIFDGQDPAGKQPAGSYTVGVKYSGGSKSHMLQMSVRTSGKEMCALQHGAGMGVVATAGGTNSCILRNAAGDKYVEVNDKGVNLNGNTKVVGALTIGPAPLPMANGPAVVAAIGALAAAVAQITALPIISGPAPGAPAAVAAVAPLLLLIPTKFVTGS